MDNQPSGYTQGAGDNNGGRSDGAFAEQHQQQHQQQVNRRPFIMATTWI